MTSTTNNEPDNEELKEEECFRSFVGWKEYIDRWKGKEIGNSNYKPVLERVIDGSLSAIGAFIGLFVVCVLHYKSDPLEGNMFVASFGASAVLIYAAPEAPLSQPWNFIFGHLLAAFIGVTFRNIFGNDSEYYYVSAPLSCAVTILFQHVFLCVHPPGGATAMIANALPITARWSGYYFLVTPIGFGVVILTVVAFVFNNIFHRRQYPHRWAAFF